MFNFWDRSSTKSKAIKVPSLLNDLLILGLAPSVEFLNKLNQLFSTLFIDSNSIQRGLTMKDFNIFSTDIDVNALRYMNQDVKRDHIVRLLTGN